MSLESRVTDRSQKLRGLLSGHVIHDTYFYFATYCIAKGDEKH